MKVIHKDPAPLAGTTVHIKAFAAHPQVPDFGGAEFRVEDWWDRVSGGSWMDTNGNPACFVYAMRAALVELPMDNEVLYGKIGALGHLVHVSEIEAT